MDRKSALAAAAAVTMTVAGGISALFVTMASSAGTAAPALVTVEYVDVAGNPIPDPTATVAPDAESPARADATGSEGERGAEPIAYAESEDHEEYADHEDHEDHADHEDHEEYEDD